MYQTSQTGQNYTDYVISKKSLRRDLEFFSFLSFSFFLLHKQTKVWAYDELDANYMIGRD